VKLGFETVWVRLFIAFFAKNTCTTTGHLASAVGWPNVGGLCHDPGGSASAARWPSAGGWWHDPCGGGWHGVLTLVTPKKVWVSRYIVNNSVVRSYTSQILVIYSSFLFLELKLKKFPDKLMRSTIVSHKTCIDQTLVQTHLAIIYLLIVKYLFCQNVGWV
jgi:hypothetical protein